MLGTKLNKETLITNYKLMLGGYLKLLTLATLWWSGFVRNGFLRGLWMPRSRGYGDVTSTYICRSKIPSCIYAKHQYK